MHPNCREIECMRISSKKEGQIRPVLMIFMFLAGGRAVVIIHYAIICIAS